MFEGIRIAQADIPEEEKLKDEYLHKEIDYTINACQYLDKEKFQKAYNLRNGVRDAEKFQYLWQAYGIEFPSQMRHIPTLRAIFDSLLGQAQARQLKFNLTATDTDSACIIFDEFKNVVLKEIESRLEDKLNALQAQHEGQPADDMAPLSQYLSDLQKKIKMSFKSELEVDGRHMLNWLNIRFQFKSLLDEMFNDLITSGQEYYQVKVMGEGIKPLVRILNPMNLFYLKPDNVKFIKNCDRVMYRERLPVNEVWALYGHKMTKEQQDKFATDYKHYIESDIKIVAYDFGVLEKDTQNNAQKGITMPMIEVYYVEWKANVKVPLLDLSDDDMAVEGDTVNKIRKKKTRYKYRLDRFEGIRIGTDMHIACGRSAYIVRDPDDQSNCDLTINGACFNDRNGEPYSLVLKTEDIADKIDIMHYHAENLLAISGTKAVAVNFPDIPVWLGENEITRVMKWLGYLKQGIAIVDYSQEGAGAGKFNQMSDLDLSVSNSLLTIYKMIEALEDTAYKITGVSRQALGSITQNDGKGTSEIAIQGTQIVTLPLFSLHNQVTQMFLTDVLNASRIAYGKGVQGSYILGDAGQQIFSIKSKQFKLAHFNVWVNIDGEEEKDLEAVKGIAMKLIDAQLIDSETAVNMVTMKSITKLKQTLIEAVQNQKGSQLSQLQQQVAELQKQLKDAQGQTQQFSQVDLQIKQAQLQLENSKLAQVSATKDREMDIKEKLGQGKLDNDSKRVDLEALQLAYEPSAREVKNN